MQFCPFHYPITETFLWGKKSVPRAAGHGGVQIAEQTEGQSTTTGSCQTTLRSRAVPSGHLAIHQQNRWRPTPTSPGVRHQEGSAAALHHGSGRAALSAAVQNRNGSLLLLILSSESHHSH